MEALTLTSVVLIFLGNVVRLQAVDKKAWSKIKAIPTSYFQVSTPNIARCDKMCAKQGNCAAVTFDGQARICYMHDTDVHTIEASSTGHYMYKVHQQTQVRKSDCDKNTQIALETARTEHEHCHNIREAVATTEATDQLTTDESSTALLATTTVDESTKALETTTTVDEITTALVTSTTVGGWTGIACLDDNECGIRFSECRTVDTTCGCLAGYSYRASTHSCEEGCNQYGITFQSFPGYFLLDGDILFEANATTFDECRMSCIDATTYICVTFDFEAAVGFCSGHAYDSLDQPNSYMYVPWIKSTHYQRNCA